MGRIVLSLGRSDSLPREASRVRRGDGPSVGSYLRVGSAQWPICAGAMKVPQTMAGLILLSWGLMAIQTSAPSDSLYFGVRSVVNSLATSEPEDKIILG